VEEATDHINKRLNCLYSEGDISNAFKKLEKLELVERVGRRTYRASPGALDAWAEVDKIRR
jgi:DNA-binding transcriptional regulator GbsR (MarR family)